MLNRQYDFCNNKNKIIERIGYCKIECIIIFAESHDFNCVYLHIYFLQDTRVFTTLAKKV